MPGLPAIVAAGEGRAAKRVAGESKVYLEVAGRPLVEHVVSALQRVPEVSEVWVVGNAERLARVLGGERLRAELTKPLTIVPEFRNLYENAWQTFRRLLPGAGPEGRDPRPDEAEQPVLYLSADLPFATPQEISSFIAQSLKLDCDYALGLVPAETLVPFAPRHRGEAGIAPAYFNVKEGRFRQSNLHLVRPQRLGHRQYVEDMYEHRYQKQLGNALALAWRLLTFEGGGFGVVFFYALIHLAGVADRHGLRWLADALRRFVSFPRIESAVSRLLDTRYRFVVTDVGGCAVDVDTEAELEAARTRYEEWRRQQEELATRRHGPLPLPARAAAPAALRVLPRGRRTEDP